jgi:hypothetical protein
MKLPSSVPSLLGPVSVLQGPETDKLLNRTGNCGSFHMDSREIRVSRKMPECLQVQTLGHEIFHVVLEDSGMKNMLDEKLQEALADAFGTWFHAAVQARFVFLDK